MTNVVSALTAGTRFGQIMKRATEKNERFVVGRRGALRAGLSELQLEYVAGVQSTMTVWEPGVEPLPAKRWKGQGRPPTLLRRNRKHQPVSVRQLALTLAGRPGRM